MSAPWLLDHAPYTPFLEPRTARPPGLSPLGRLPLVSRDADFEAQMAERARLLSEVPQDVLACLTEGCAPASELLALVAGQTGRAPADPSHPLESLGHMVAEDWCLLLPDPAAGEYRLVAAVLCFPSRWRLAEKLGRPLTAIHDPVPDYAGSLARRVNRVFETLVAGRALWRANWLIHATPELHLPMDMEDKRSPERSFDPGADPAAPLYLRTERQTLTRLERSGAVAFGIKTSITPLERLSVPELRALRAQWAALTPEEIDYRARSDLHAAALETLERLAGVA